MAYPKKNEEDKYVRQNISFPPQLMARLLNFCQLEERSISWTAQKALDQWLQGKGY